MIIRPLILVIAMSSTAHAAETRSADAHEHGVGKLNIAIEKTEIMMELEVPGSDIVGFEHAPTNSEDKKTVADAIRKLETIGTVLDITSIAGCRQKSVEVDMHIEDEEDHADEKHDAHKSGHDDEKEEHHDDKSGHHDEKEEEHAEFHAKYNLVCTDTAALQDIRFTYFTTFPNAKELDVQMLTRNGATSVEVTPTRNAISLK